MRLGTLGLGAALALAMPSISFPEAAPEPGSARNRPSGNTPVPGGGAKERAKRIAQMEAAAAKAAKA